MPQINLERRPSEIVLGYLRAEFSKPGVNAGLRLPSISALAKHLSVSPSTVQAVLGELARNGEVKSVRGKGVFLAKKQESEPVKSQSKVVTINLQTSEINSAQAWVGGISVGILETFSRYESGLLLRPSKKVENDEWDEQLLAQECKDSDGAILFHRHGHRRYCRAFEQAGKPIVHINPPRVNATSNFVSTDYYSNGYRIAKTWLATGRKRLGLVLHASPKVNVSAMLLVLGFRAALEELPDHAAFQFSSMSASYSEGLMPEQIWSGLCRATGQGPDAIYFVSPILGDQLAHYLRKQGLKVPSDVSLVAGTDDSTPVAMTVFSQSLKSLGGKAAEVMAWRLNHQNQDAPGVYISCNYIAGGTTRKEEDAFMTELIARPS